MPLDRIPTVGSKQSVLHAANNLLNLNYLRVRVRPYGSQNITGETRKREVPGENRNGFTLLTRRQRIYRWKSKLGTWTG